MVLQKMTLNAQVFIQSHALAAAHVKRNPAVKNWDTNPDGTVVLNISSRGSAAHKTLTSGLQ